MKSINLFLILISLIVLIKNEYLNSKNNQTLNSVSLTGDIVKDKIYISKCNLTCPKTLCCQGSDLNNLICKDYIYCEILNNEKLINALELVLEVYFGVLLIFSSILFFVIYILSIKFYSKKQSFLNSLYVAIISISIGFIIPIIILLILAKIKNKSLIQLFRANFDNLYFKSFISIETLTEQRNSYLSNKKTTEQLKIFNKDGNSVMLSEIRENYPSPILKVNSTEDIENQPPNTNVRII